MNAMRPKIRNTYPIEIQVVSMVNWVISSGDYSHNVPFNPRRSYKISPLGLQQNIWHIRHLNCYLQSINMHAFR